MFPYICEQTCNNLLQCNLSRYNLSPETLKKLVLIHDNLPRVHQEIKTWNLKLSTSESSLSTTATQADLFEGEDADSSEAEADEPSSAADSLYQDYQYSSTWSFGPINPKTLRRKPETAILLYSSRVDSLLREHIFFSNLYLP